jgi:hypothetical protein
MLIRTQRLTDTVRHFNVKLAWLNENFLRHTFQVAYSKSAHMLVDCCTKPNLSMALFCFSRYHLRLAYDSIQILLQNIMWIFF